VVFPMDYSVLGVVDFVVAFCRLVHCQNIAGQDNT